MACYDCEDCNRSIKYGGKCRRFEYSCPFTLIEQMIENKDNVLALKFQVMIKNSKDMLEELKVLNKDYNLHEDISRLNFFITELEDKISDELINEYNKITSVE